MGGAAPVWILVITFAVMIGAVVLDRAGAPAPDAPSPIPGRNGHVPQAALAEPVPTAALPGPPFAELSADADGWALVGPAGTVVATNLPERAALLAGACAVLRLASGEQAGQPLPWRTVTLEGPSGVLLGEASPRGAVLAVLARHGADVGRLRAEMGAALGEVERRWPLALAAARPWAVSDASGRGESPVPGDVPAAAAGPAPEDGAAPSGAYLPLD